MITNETALSRLYLDCTQKAKRCKELAASASVILARMGGTFPIHETDRQDLLLHKRKEEFAQSEYSAARDKLLESPFPG